MARIDDLVNEIGDERVLSVPLVLHSGKNLESETI